MSGMGLGSSRSLVVVLALAAAPGACAEKSAWQPVGLCGGGGLFNPAVSPHDAKLTAELASCAECEETCPQDLEIIDEIRKGKAVMGLESAGIAGAESTLLGGHTKCTL
jgi:hypothetical protein